MQAAMHNEFIFFVHLIVSLMPLMLALYADRLELCFCLSALYIVLANMFVMKEVVIFNLHTTPVEPLALAVFFVGNSIHARYGEKSSWKIVWYTWIAILVAACTLLSVAYYVPSSTDLYHGLYILIIDKTLRSIIVSIIVFSAAYSLERVCYRLLSRNNDFSIYFISLVAITVSQLIDTVLYSIFMFFDRPFSILFEQIVYSYSLKLIIIMLFFFINNRIKKYV